MIGQHPEMHAFPELQIFGHDRLLDMLIKNQESLNRMASPGAIRAIAEVHEQVQSNESCTRAWLWMLKHSQMSPKDFFDYLRGKISPLIAIEKTPPNTLKMSRLRQIVSAYPNAKYLHLTRSAKGNDKSLREYLDEMCKLLGKPIAVDDLSMDILKEYPASIWLASHRNILNARPVIKPGNYLRVKGEDILNKPIEMLRNICKWIGVDSKDACLEAMMRPHESPYAYIGPRIAYGGNDGKFMRQPVLRLKSRRNNIEHSFQEAINARHLNLHETSLFTLQSELTELDIRRIEQWMNHLYIEVMAMQKRLGY